MSCPHQPSCPLFKLFASSTVLASWQRLYCDSPTHVDCERYKLSTQMKPVPVALLPNGHTLLLPTVGKAGK